MYNELYETGRGFIIKEAIRTWVKPPRCTIYISKELLLSFIMFLSTTVSNCQNRKLSVSK